MMRRIQLLVLLTIGAVGFQGCKLINEESKPANLTSIINQDLDVLKEMGTLKVAIDYNSTNYFIYKGTPMGYQLEMLQELCNYLSIKLEVTVSNDMAKNYADLKAGHIDLIATNLIITNDNDPQIDYTEPHSYTRQVLVQRKYDQRQEYMGNKEFNEIIRNQLDLAGKTIYVQDHSAHYDRLLSLSNEIGDSIHAIQIPDYEAEQLIGLVATGEIEYTVCDENLAAVNKRFYPNIDISTAISFPQKIGWAVRKSSPQLLASVNKWMTGFRASARYRNIYNKYYLAQRSIHLPESEYNSLKSGQVSVFDEIIKIESNEINWDWRLVASLIYQESRFIPDAQSWAGAQGLMQLMPETALGFGVSDVNSPTENIQGGIRFIKWLDNQMKSKIEDPAERIKFILASYNAGIGHVYDAMQLAKKNGKNPTIWENNVDFYLLNKSNPIYFNDPVVKYGYCRGQEPYQYVKEILERYQHYKTVMTQ